MRDSTVSSQPLRLLATNGDFVEAYSLDYHGGMRYPHLSRTSGAPDYPDEIIRPLATSTTIHGMSVNKRAEK